MEIQPVLVDNCFLDSEDLKAAQKGSSRSSSDDDEGLPGAGGQSEITVEGRSSPKWQPAVGYQRSESCLSAVPRCEV